MMPCVTISTDFTVGTSPSVVELDRIVACGFRTIVDLRAADEASAQTIANESKILRFCCAKLLHIPVPQQAVPGELLDEFRREIAAMPKPAYVHSTGGARATVFTVLHLGLEVGASDDDIIARLHGVEFFSKLAPQEEGIRAYVRTAGKPYERLEQVIW